MSRYAFGVDIGGTTVKIGLFDDSGMLTDKWEIKTRKTDRGSHILGDIAESIREKRLEQRVDVEDIIGIGVGVPGPVLQERIVNKCVNLGWGVTDVADALEELTGVSNIKVANDANTAALGELWKGGGKGSSSAVMVTLGTGVGGGIVVGGRIIAGAFGASGEIGHITVSDTEEVLCGCGKRGHLEQYVSATGIARKAQELLTESDKPSALRDITYPTAKDVFDAAKKGDELALEIVEFVGDTLGKALASVSCVIDPETYVIGGGVSKAGQILIDTIQSHFVKYAFHASEKAGFRLAQLGNDAGMYGAVRMVLE